MRFHLTMLASLIVLVSGCGQQTAPKVSIDKGQAAKERLLKMNDKHQEKLEQLILPGQD